MLVVLVQTLSMVVVVQLSAVVFLGVESKRLVVPYALELEKCLGIVDP